MKKLIIIILLINFMLMPFITSATIYAESEETESGIISSEMKQVAKGIGALFLLNRLSRYFPSSEKEAYDSRTSSQRSEREQVSELIKDSGFLSGKVIVIDPGHGGHDPGAIGPTGLKESEVVLDISLSLYRILKANTEAEVYITRKDDRFIPLGGRSALANNLEADIFISVHINADEWGRNQGIETFAHYNAPRETWAMAWYIHDNLVKQLNLENNGLKADNFQVLRETTNNMKSILLEIGYISHYYDENFFRNYNNRERAARAVYHGLLDYYSQ